MEVTGSHSSSKFSKSKSILTFFIHHCFVFLFFPNVKEVFSVPNLGLHHCSTSKLKTIIFKIYRNGCVLIIKTSYLDNSCSLRQCCLFSTLPDRVKCSISSAGCSAGRRLSGYRSPDGWTHAGSHWTTSWETETGAWLEKNRNVLMDLNHALVKSESYRADKSSSVGAFMTMC